MGLSWCANISFSLSYFTCLAQEKRGRAPILVYDDSGIFPDAKCIIPSVLLCLPSESLTTVCYRAEQGVEQKWNTALAARFTGEVNTISFACMPAHFSRFVCVFKEFEWKGG